MSAVVVAVLLCWSGPASAATTREDAESGFLGLVNKERLARGLGGLVSADDLVAVARRHTTEMVRQDDVFHNPRLASEVQGWELLGENVGVGPTVEEIHRAFMASQVHRDVLLDPRFTQMGVGVVIVGNAIWLTQVFRQPEVRSAPPTSAPRTSVPPTTSAPDAAAPPTTARPNSPARAPQPRPPVAPRPPAPAQVPADAVPAPAGSALTAGAVATTPAPAPAPDRVARVVVVETTAANAAVLLPAPETIPDAGVVAAALLLAVVGGSALSQHRLRFSAALRNYGHVCERGY